MLVLDMRHLSSVCASTLLLLVNLFTVNCDIHSIFAQISEVDAISWIKSDELSNLSKQIAMNMDTKELLNYVSTNEVDWDRVWKFENFDSEEERLMDEMKEMFSEEVPVKSERVHPWPHLKSLIADDPMHRMYKFQKFINRTDEERRKVGSPVKYNIYRSRWRCLTSINAVNKKSSGIVYWMFRDLRVQDNWAMIFAQKLAIMFEMPLHVVYYARQKFLQYNERHWGFILAVLQEIAADLSNFNIQFHLLYGDGEEKLPLFIEKFKLGAVVLDFMPLRDPVNWAKTLATKLNNTIPVYQVDAHNTVPTWIHKICRIPYASKTISMLKFHLETYLTKFPNIIGHPHNMLAADHKEIDWDYAYRYYHVLKSDYTNKVRNAYYPPPGIKGAWLTLFFFLDRRLRRYYISRLNPVINGLSNLSPYLHFGVLSRQRVFLIISGSQGFLKNRTWKSIYSFNHSLYMAELADSYCLYNTNYDKLTGAPLWGQETLSEHRNDTRQHIYSLEELETYQTDDDLWNACQKLAVDLGKIHDSLRPYWGRKLLEWTETPEEAFNACIYLNNKYSIDGNDPISYFGCITAVASNKLKSPEENPIYGYFIKPNIKRLEQIFNIPHFIYRVLGMEAYERSKGKYQLPPEKEQKYFSLKLKNMKTEEQEDLGKSGDEKMPDSNFLIKADVLDRKLRENYERRKKLYGV